MHISILSEILSQDNLHSEIFYTRKEALDILRKKLNSIQLLIENSPQYTSDNQSERGNAALFLALKTLTNKL